MKHTVDPLLEVETPVSAFCSSNELSNIRGMANSALLLAYAVECVKQFHSFISSDPYASDDSRLPLVVHVLLVEIRVRECAYSNYLDSRSFNKPHS